MEVAEAWVEILSTEGLDVLAYLKVEEALHQPCLLSTRSSDLPGDTRQLHFDFGQNPSVYADWWVVPDSPACLARQVFKDLNAIQKQHCWYWKDAWPFNFYYIPCFRE